MDIIKEDMDIKIEKYQLTNGGDMTSPTTTEQHYESSELSGMIENPHIYSE